jgi:hypothetical protein
MRRMIDLEIRQTRNVTLLTFLGASRCRLADSDCLTTLPSYLESWRGCATHACNGARCQCQVALQYADFPSSSFVRWWVGIGWVRWDGMANGWTGWTVCLPVTHHLQIACSYSTQPPHHPTIAICALRLTNHAASRESFFSGVNDDRGSPRWTESSTCIRNMTTL